MAMKKHTPHIRRHDRRRDCNQRDCLFERHSAYPKTDWRSILVQLKPDESVDEDTPVERCYGSCIDGSEPRIDLMRGRDDGRVEKDGEKFDKHVNVEEQANLLPPDRSIFRSDVEQHDRRHDQRGDVNKTGSYGKPQRLNTRRTGSPG